jgi:tRNA(Ile)-lysidine synthase
LLEHLRRQEFFRPSDNIGVAVSGGADSTALLLLLLELRQELGVSLSVIHFNHQLRGRASKADEKFVSLLAETRGLALHLSHGDVRGEARRNRINLEEAGRRARYAWFARLASEGRVTRVVTAHTLDDQAETVLAHILRGTGLAGLAAIHPVAGCVVRPLLCVRRAELRGYLRTRGQSWREDASNQDTSRLRARIRKKLLPLLEKQFQPGAAAHLASLAELAREDNALLEEIAARRCRALATPVLNGASISFDGLLRPFGKRPSRSLTARMIRRLAKKAKPRAGQISIKHIDLVIDLAERGENGKSLELPGGLLVRRTHDALIFLAAATEAREHTAYEFPIDVQRMAKSPESQRSCSIAGLCCAIRLTAIDWPAPGRETKCVTGAALDRDRLRAPVVLRNWRSGDRFQPAGRTAPRLLKRLLSEKGISRWERACWPVLTSGEVVAWVRGFPAAAAFAADSNTRAAILIAEERVQA